MFDPWTGHGRLNPQLRMLRQVGWPSLNTTRLRLCGQSRLRWIHTRAHLSQLRVGVQVVASNSHYPAFALAAFDPVGYHDGHVHLGGFFPGLTAAFGADKVSRVDSNSVDQFGSDALDCGGEVFAELGGHDARSDCYAGQIRHLLRLDGQFLAGVGASAGA